MDDKNIKYIPVNGELQNTSQVTSTTATTQTSSVPTSKESADANQNNNVANSATQDQAKEVPNQEKIITINMNEIIPQSKESNQEEISNNIELNIEQPNPFDIGINSNSPETIQPTSIININPTEPNSTEQNSQTLPQSNLNELEDVIPMMTFLINIILFTIPIVGLIIGIKKYLDKTLTNKTLKNFIEAEILINGVLSALIIIITLGSIIGNMTIG